jgi:hypothetical protein
MIKYLNSRFSYLDDINEATSEVYENFEKQVMAQLFDNEN